MMNAEKSGGTQKGKSHKRRLPNPWNTCAENTQSSSATQESALRLELPPKTQGVKFKPRKKMICWDERKTTLTSEK